MWSSQSIPAQTSQIHPRMHSIQLSVAYSTHNDLTQQEKSPFHFFRQRHKANIVSLACVDSILYGKQIIMI